MCDLTTRQDLLNQAEAFDAMADQSILATDRTRYRAKAQELRLTARDSNCNDPWTQWLNGEGHAQPVI